MDIFILRDGEQTGPFNEKTVETMIADGAARLKDMAWRKGLPAWLPLSEVLNPGSQKPSEPPPAVQLSGVRAAAEPVKAATAKQKALLTYLGVELPSAASKTDAAVLVSDAMENPKFQARLSKWHEEKLKLHPDVFADEIELRKAGRGTRYVELCQTEGAGVVKDVTKAHCQVLVESLDKRFPAWESDPKTALWQYFFPAVAENFPTLVLPEWKAKLRMGSAPKGAPTKATVAAGPVVVSAQSQPGPLQAAFRGIVYGLAALGVIIGGMQLMKSRENAPVAGNQPPASADTKPATPPPVTLPPPVAPNLPENAPLIAAADPVPATPPEVPAVPVPADPAPANPVPADPPAAPAPAPAPAVPMTEPPTAPAIPPANPVPPGPPSLPRADTVPAPMPAVAAAPATPTVPAAPPAPAAPKSVLTLTKPVAIQLQFGKVTLPPGTKVRFLGADPAGLRCNFNNNIIVVPAASTDYDGTAAPATAALPPGIPAPITQPAPATPPAPKPVTPSDL